MTTITEDGLRITGSLIRLLNRLVFYFKYTNNFV